MKVSSLNISLISAASLFSCFVFFSQDAQAQSGGYYGRDQYRRDDYDDVQAERRELERDRLRLEQQRYDIEKERARVNEGIPAAPPKVESCPSGYQPSEKKCSNDERRRGCKDMRLPGGLGCVSR